MIFRKVSRCTTNETFSFLVLLERAKVCRENETRKVMFQNYKFETKDSEIENDNSKFETEEWTEVRRRR